MNALVYLTLLAVVYLLLRQHGYLTHYKWPDGLGWAAQLVNGRSTWGIRVQYEAWPSPWRGKPWRFHRGAPYLKWPSALQLRCRKVTVFLYLGVPSR